MISSTHLERLIDLLKAMDNLATSETLDARGWRAPIKGDQKKFAAAVRKYVREIGGTNADYEAILLDTGHRLLLRPNEVSVRP